MVDAAFARNGEVANDDGWVEESITPCQVSMLPCATIRPETDLEDDV